MKTALLCASILIITSISQASPEAELVRFQLRNIELESKFRENHPAMIAYREELAALQERMREVDFEAYAQAASRELTRLTIQQAEWEQVYLPKHPAMIQLRRQVNFLETIPGATLDQAYAQDQLKRLQNEVSLLRARYREAHPKMSACFAKIVAIQQILAGGPAQ